MGEFINPADVPKVKFYTGDEAPCIGMGTFGSDRFTADQIAEEACKKSIADLQCDYVDMYYIHWPFPNYHAPKCDVESRNPDSKPFSVEEFMNTYRQCEKLVEDGLTRFIGISNMTIPKLEAVLPLMKIKPVACELEIHPCFQQQDPRQMPPVHPPACGRCPP